MNERQLTNIFIKSALEDGYEAVNIPDSSGFCDLPYDIIFNNKGKFVPIEFKRITDYKSFNPKMLRDGQIRGLNRSQKRGGFPIVGLFIWKPRTYNRFLWWNWEEFKEKTNNLTTSIKKNELMSMIYCDCKKKKYHLEKFYKYLDLYTTL